MGKIILGRKTRLLFEVGVRNGATWKKEEVVIVGSLIVIRKGLKFVFFFV